MLLLSLDEAQKRVRTHAASNIPGLAKESGGGDDGDRPRGGPGLGMNVEDVE